MQSETLDRILAQKREIWEWGGGAGGSMKSQCDLHLS